MTAEELLKKFNTEFGLNAWPATYEVDAETYAYVCHYVFNWAANYSINTFAPIKLGLHNGIVFKNVELILEAKK